MSSERRYNEWSGNPKGVPENKSNCVAQVMHGYHFVQCSRKRGYGKDAEYCVQHAKRHPAEILGHKNTPPAMSFDQVNMICEMLRKAGEEILRLRGAQ